VTLSDLLAAVGITVTLQLAALGLIWWEIRTLRKSTHGHATDITALYGRCGLLEHRVTALERRP